MADHVFKKGDRVNWLGKEMYLGHVVEVSPTEKGQNLYPKEVAVWREDRLTFIPVQGPDGTEERLSVSLREAQGLVKTKAFTFE